MSCVDSARVAKEHSRPPCVTQHRHHTPTQASESPPPSPVAARPSRFAKKRPASHPRWSPAAPSAPASSPPPPRHAAACGARQQEQGTSCQHWRSCTGQGPQVEQQLRRVCDTARREGSNPKGEHQFWVLSLVEPRLSLTRAATSVRTTASQDGAVAHLVLLWPPSPWGRWSWQRPAAGSPRSGTPGG